MSLIKLSHYDVSIKTKPEAPQLGVSQPQNFWTHSHQDQSRLKGRHWCPPASGRGGRASVITRWESICVHKAGEHLWSQGGRGVCGVTEASDANKAWSTYLALGRALRNCKSTASRLTLCEQSSFLGPATSITLFWKYVGITCIWRSGYTICGGQCWGLNSGLCGFEASTLSFVSSPLYWV